MQVIQVAQQLATAIPVQLLVTNNSKKSLPEIFSGGQTFKIYFFGFAPYLFLPLVPF